MNPKITFEACLLHILIQKNQKPVYHQIILLDSSVSILFTNNPA